MFSQRRTADARSAPPSRLLLGARDERGAHPLVECEEVLDALALGGKLARPVEAIHRAVERLVRAAEVRRHEVRIVEVGEGRVGVGGAGVEDGLGECVQR